MSVEDPLSKENADQDRMAGDKSQPRHHPFFYVGGTFLNAVVFAVVGPLVGGVLMAIGITGWNLKFSDLVFAPALLLPTMLLTVPVSYYLAVQAAALTGAIVAIASIWMTYRPSLYLAAAIAGGLVSSLLLSRAEFFTKGENPQSPLLLLFVVGSVASIVCTRIAKPFRLGVPAAPDQLNAPRDAK